MKLFLLLVAIFGIAHCQLSCGGVNCPDGNDACCRDVNIGETCYNTSTHFCFFSSFLCALGDGVCNGVCYSPLTHVCLFQGGAEVLCGKGLLSCGVNHICYDPRNYICVNNVIFQKPSPYVCANNLECLDGQCCGDTGFIGTNQCFNPTNLSCAQDPITQNFLVCPITNLGKVQRACNIATGLACYDPDFTVCCATAQEGVGVICNLGDTACCSAPIGPAVLPTVATTQILIPATSQVVAPATTEIVAPATTEILVPATTQIAVPATTEIIAPTRVIVPCVCPVVNCPVLPETAFVGATFVTPIFSGAESYRAFTWFGFFSVVVTSLYNVI